MFTYYFIASFQGFLRGANEVFALLGCYSAFIGDYLQKFRDKLATPCVGHLKKWQKCFPETSVNNYNKRYAISKQM
jgi:hypothetical protein